MKQINLLPKKAIEETLVFIHPFWKSFFKFSCIAIVLSLLFPYLMYRIQSQTAETLDYLTEFSSGLQDEREWFNALIEERRELESRVESLKNRSSEDESNTRNFAVGIFPIIQKVMERLPDEVWLHDFNCDYNNHTVQLTGYSTKKESIQTFLNDGLMQFPEFHDLIVHNLRRMDEKNTFFFHASFQFYESADGKKERTRFP